MSSTNPVIAKTNNFTVKVPNLPHITRDEGGHIFVETNNGYENRWEFSEEEAVEEAWLTQLAGEAFFEAMRDELELYKLNFQDNGNWAYVDGKKPLFHIHIYGRSEREKDDKTKQGYGQALNFPWRDSGYYDNMIALSQNDMTKIANQMEKLSQKERYQWKNMNAAICNLELLPA